MGDHHVGTCPGNSSILMASKHVFHIKMYRNPYKHSKSVVRLFALLIQFESVIHWLHFAWGVAAEAKCILVMAVCMRVSIWCMYVCLCVCLTVCPRPTLMHGPGCNLGTGRGCPLVVDYWADLQSVHGFRCYDNIAMNAKYQRVLVLALYLELWNFRRGRHLYSAGRPSRLASVITLVCARYSAMSALWDSLIIMSEILRIICNSLFMFDFYSVVKKVAQ